MAPADATAAGKLTGKVHRRTWAPDGSARAWHCMSGPTPWDAESPKKPTQKGDPLGEVKEDKNWGTKSHALDDKAGRGDGWSFL